MLTSPVVMPVIRAALGAFDPSARAGMQAWLAEVARKLAGREPIATAASIVQEILEGQVAHVLS